MKTNPTRLGETNLQLPTKVEDDLVSHVFKILPKKSDPIPPIDQ